MNDTVIIIPAYNEEACLGTLLDEIIALELPIDIVVVSDGSTDQTGPIAKKHGAVLIDLPCNLGVGGAVQAGYAYAHAEGYQYTLRCDADGRHPPSEISRMLAEIKKGEADLVVGSRFLGTGEYTTDSMTRMVGVQALAKLLSVICRAKVTDPTSGFHAMSRLMTHFFAFHYPSEYPEPEALALMRRQGYTFKEVGV